MAAPVSASAAAAALALVNAAPGWPTVSLEPEQIGMLLFAGRYRKMCSDNDNKTRRQRALHALVSPDMDECLRQSEHEHTQLTKALQAIKDHAKQFMPPESKLLDALATASAIEFIDVPEESRAQYSCLFGSSGPLVQATIVSNLTNDRPVFMVAAEPWRDWMRAAQVTFNIDGVINALVHTSSDPVIACKDIAGSAAAAGGEKKQRCLCCMGMLGSEAFEAAQRMANEKKLHEVWNDAFYVFRRELDGEE